jgi:hypothetical protein
MAGSGDAEAIGCGARAGIEADQDKPRQVAKRALLGRQRWALRASTPAPLKFAVSPADPKKPGGLISCQPAITRWSFWRQYDFDDASVQSFASVIIDRGTKVFQIAPGSAGIAALALISAAGVAGHLGQLLAAPPVIQTFDTAVKLKLVLL